MREKEPGEREDEDTLLRRGEEEKEERREEGGKEEVGCGQCETIRMMTSASSTQRRSVRLLISSTEGMPFREKRSQKKPTNRREGNTNHEKMDHLRIDNLSRNPM